MPTVRSTTDPFTFVEKDGFYYGRGTQDMKSGDAIMGPTLIRFKKEGFTPDRDIILALTADDALGTWNRTKRANDYRQHFRAEPRDQLET